MAAAPGPQPDFEQMAQATATLVDNITNCRNLPAVEGSAAILASLQRIEQRMERMEQTMERMEQRMDSIDLGISARYALPYKKLLCFKLPTTCRHRQARLTYVIIATLITSHAYITRKLAHMTSHSCRYATHRPTLLLTTFLRRLLLSRTCR